MVRERLAEVIQREDDLIVCGEADDRRQAVAAVETTRPDLAIIDLSLKNSHGLELIKDLHVRSPRLAMLVVSMHDESLHAERVIYAGARGYITKQEATRNILYAIRTVLQGDVYLSDKMALHLAAKMARQPGSQQRESIDRLTDRELGVFEMIGQGYGTRQIAQTLRLHMRTVETYRARIKDKLGLKDADELRQFAIRWQQSGSLR